MEWAERRAQVYGELEAAIQSRQEILSIVGAFGDIENCEGYIQATEQAPEGGVLVRLFGCTARFKGWPDNKIVEGIGLAKAMVSVFPRLILADSLPLRLFLCFLFLFQRSRLIHYLHVYASMIYGHVVLKVAFPVSKYNRCVRELKRALDVVLARYDRKILSRDREPLAASGISTNFDARDGAGAVERRKLLKALSQLAEFGWLFLEHDNAYRFPLQDVLPMLDKQALMNNPRRELLRLFDILLERANEHGIRHKAVQLRRLLSLALFSGTLKSFLCDFLFEVNTKQVALDDDDWYFCLKRRGYAFRGMTIEERLRIKERLDRKQVNLRLQLLDIQMPNEPVVRGFRVVRFDDFEDLDRANGKATATAELAPQLLVV